MLIQFKLENFRSFKTQKVFHTVQRNYKRFTNHVYKYDDKLSLLKTSGIYGGNGSGKTNLFRGLYFVKRMTENNEFLLTYEADKILTPFKLDNGYNEKTSNFQVDFIANNNIYLYDLRIHSKTKIVVFEELILMNGDKEITVFKRTEENDIRELFFSEDSALNGIKDLLIDVVNPYSTVLSTKIINETDIIIANNWFENKLKFLFPVYEFNDIAYILSLKTEYLELANKIIKFSKVGIDRLIIEKIPIDTYLGTEDIAIKRRIENVLGKKEYHPFKDTQGNACTAKKNEKGEIEILKLISVHLNREKEDVRFDLEQESRGTIVLLHLLPALILSYGEGVNYFIDEISASLHPIVLKEILSQYFQYNLGDAKGQIIFNSHEDFLLDEKMLRQDELWLVEKNKYGETDVFPLSDIPNIRFDLNLKKNYLNGRFGGVPFNKKPEKLLFDDINKE